jgi:glycosyltransferase involved in cell wall biosynthesis
MVQNRYIWSIESIMAQEYTNFRLIIIDDFSDDGTGD